MVADALTLDGNAAGGVLSEVFGTDVTARRGACAWCGWVAMVAEHRWYMHPSAPGGVLRCCNCGGPLIVVARLHGRLRFGLPGVRWLDAGRRTETR